MLPYSHPETEPPHESPLELVSEETELTVRLHAALTEFSDDIISYRTEDIARYGKPGDQSVRIWAPRTWGQTVLRAIE